tara:strand:+ start:365 stop:1228 length:864 start_codon:yes stop_codon:yes gene_type:complete
MSGSPRRVLAIEREDRFEAARGILVASLERGHRADGWFRAPGVAGRHFGRDCTIAWSGGPHAKRVALSTRIRCGESWSARGRGWLLTRLGFRFLVLRGQETPDGFQVERLLRDYGVDRLWGGEGMIQARARWDPDQPDPQRLLKILERLHRLALGIEGVMVPLTEDGGQLSCPFCRAPILEEDPLARCEACYTPHHPSCFEEHGGCALLGCENRSARTRSGRYPRKPEVLAEEAEAADLLPADGVGAPCDEASAGQAQRPEPAHLDLDSQTPDEGRARDARQSEPPS